MKGFLSACMFTGFITFTAGLIFSDPGRVWSAFLVASLFVFFLSLGGAFFLAVQYVTRAVWSVNIRRFMEAFSAYIPLGCVSALCLAFSGEALYEWLDPSAVKKDPLLVHKAPYLNWLFFVVRLLIFSLISVGFSQWLIRLSLRRDKTGDGEGTSRKVSVAFLLCFALGFTFFSVDTVMSLEPHWFSTVFGVYAFAGLLQAFTAALALILMYFTGQGFLKGAVTENHFHDLGKFLFGFTIFWAYIAFSQYMLIWYANLPEEAIYYLPRSQHSWLWVSVSLIVFKFILPFLFLLPRVIKRSRTALTAVCILILVMEYVDIYWMVYPAYDKEHAHFGVLELGLFAGFFGLFLYSVFSFLSRHPLIPLNDPAQAESSSHKVTY